MMRYTFGVFLMVVCCVSCTVSKTRLSHSPEDVGDRQIEQSRSAEDSTDLNGDGVKDKIRFEYTAYDYGENYGEYVLCVNDTSIGEYGENLYGFHEVVDIDVSDGIKEIAISEAGPSDDYATTFYYYDGRRIMHMGKISGAYEVDDSHVKIDGAGIVQTISRGRVLHTWFYPDAYRLSDEHKLEHIDQELYWMNYPVTVKMALPLQKTRMSDEPVVTLQPGDQIKILMSDNKAWFLVEDSRGIKGWSAVDGYDEIRALGKPADEVFEGLCHAD